MPIPDIRLKLQNNILKYIFRQQAMIIWPKRQSRCWIEKGKTDNIDIEALFGYEFKEQFSESRSQDWSPGSNFTLFPGDRGGTAVLIAYNSHLIC